MKKDEELTKKVDIYKLREWNKNPRAITKSGYQRLLKQLKRFGQYKPLIIDQNNIVLGGNMRLKAMRELGVKKVWVSTVNCKNDTERMEYALSDNDQAGYYDADDFFNLLPEFKLPDLEEFGISFKSVLTLKQLNALMSKPQNETPVNLRKQTITDLVNGYRKYLENLSDKDLSYEKTYALWK